MELETIVRSIIGIPPRINMSKYWAKIISEENNHWVIHCRVCDSKLEDIVTFGHLHRLEHTLVCENCHNTNWFCVT